MFIVHIYIGILLFMLSVYQFVYIEGIGVGGLIDRGVAGMGKVFQLVILQALYSLWRG